MGTIRWIGLASFSAWFWTVAFAWMGVCTLVTAALRLVGVKYATLHPHVSAPMFAACVRFAGNRVRVTYDEELDPDRDSVFCQNHVNLLDAHVASTVIPRPFCGLMNAWQFHIPIYGWMMWLSHGIAVKRRVAGQTVRLISDAARRRKSMGMSVLAFPEAHRTRDGRVHEFRTGVFAMARDAGLPVVPIATRGNFAANKKGTMLFSPGHLFDVYVGPQFETHGLTDQQLRALANGLRDLIAHWVEHGVWPQGARSRVGARVADPTAGTVAAGAPQ